MFFALELFAPIVQLDRTSDSGSEGWGFDSSWAYNVNDHLGVVKLSLIGHLVVIRLSLIGHWWISIIIN
jgi:hypothetical protein